MGGQDLVILKIDDSEPPCKQSWLMRPQEPKPQGVIACVGEAAKGSDSGGSATRGEI